MKQCGAKNVISTLFKGQNEQQNILQSLGKLSQFGFNSINWSKIMGDSQIIQRIKYLPTYPFQRRDCFLFIDTLEHQRHVPEFFHDKNKSFAGALLGRKVDCTEQLWTGLINSFKFPWLKDHVVHNATIFPGAGYIEICLEFMMTQYYLKNKKKLKKIIKEEEEEEENEGEEIEIKEEEKEEKEKNLLLIIKNVKILNPLIIPTEQLNFSTIETKIDSRGSVNISSRKQNNIEKKWMIHMNCRIEKIKEIIDEEEEENNFNLKIPKIEGNKMTKEEIYSRFEVLQNLKYGKTFRLIENIIQGDEEVLATINTFNLLNSKKIEHDVNNWYVCHPGLMDNIFQCFLLTYKEMKTYLPTSIKRFEIKKSSIFNICPKKYKKLFVHCYLLDRNDKKLIGNCIVFSEKGKELIKIEEFEFTSTGNNKSSSSSSSSSKKEKKQLYNCIWQKNKLISLNEENKFINNNNNKYLEKNWIKKIEKNNLLKKLKNYIILKIKPSLKRLKSLTIPKDKHHFINWIDDQKIDDNEEEFFNNEKEFFNFFDEEYEKKEKDNIYNLELKLIKNIIKYLPMIIRKKSKKLTEGKKRDEYISNFFSLNSISHKPNIFLFENLFKNILKIFNNSNSKKKKKRVLRILEIGEHHYFSFLNHLLPILLPLENSIEIITNNNNNNNKYNFVHFKKIDFNKSLINQGIFYCFFDIIIINGHSCITTTNELFKNSLKKVLVNNGLLCILDYRDNYSKFISDFIFGSILENWKPSKRIKNLKNWAIKNNYNISNLINTNSSSILFARKKDEIILKNEEEEEEEEIIIFNDSNILKLLDFIQLKISKKEFKKLIIITKGVFDPILPKLEFASNIGFIRSLQNEFLEWPIRIVDLPTSSINNQNQENLLIKKFIIPKFNDLENECRIDINGQIFVPRIFINNKINNNIIKKEQKKKDFNNNNKKPFRLYVDEPGLLNTLQFHELEEPALILKENEVYCKVFSASLNFKDVMLAMNMLKSFKPDLGLEFSGIILRLGKNIKDLKIGDEIYGFADHSLSSHVLTSRFLIHKKPKNLSFEQAASIPTVFLTTYISLIKKSKIEKNSKVLIHSAAGGIGQAALEWIKLKKAIPIATCGSKKKREFLKNKFGIKIFGNSHKDDWDREIIFQLKNQNNDNNNKIDVVLNSLAKRHIMRGIRILKPFGSFIEIGKRDILNNSPIYLKPFLENLNYFSVHIDRIINQKPFLIKPLLKEISNYFEQKLINPIKIDKIFPSFLIKKAFRYMQSGNHMGKIIINFNNSKNSEQQQPKVLSKKNLFLRSKIYILSGGLGVIGFEIVKWMIDLGARNIILLSRSGKKTKSQTRQINQLEKKTKTNIKIIISKTDVSSKNQVELMYKKIFVDDENNKNLELGGIIHLAMVLRDGNIISQTHKKFEESFGPKINGAINLIECIPSKKPDFVIFFSSISATVGNPEQSNYSAANCFLDRYANYLCKIKKIQTKVINLGAVVDVGVIAENLKLRKIMEMGVLWGTKMTLFQVLQSLSKMIEDSKKMNNNLQKNKMKKEEEEENDFEEDFEEEQIQYIPEMDVTKLIETYPRLKPKFGHLLKPIQQQKNKNSELFKEASAQTIQGIVGNLLTMSPKRVPLDEPLTRYGVDSLLAVEISSILKNKYDVSVSQMEILAGMTIDQITKIAEKE